jgi:hypothetical protein
MEAPMTRSYCPTCNRETFYRAAENPESYCFPCYIDELHAEIVDLHAAIDTSIERADDERWARCDPPWVVAPLRTVSASRRTVPTRPIRRAR